MPYGMTVELGNWTMIEPGAPSLEFTVDTALAASEVDVRAVIKAYRAAINRALPESVWFLGNQFIGPNRLTFAEVDGYPLTEVGRVDIKAIVDGIDFW